MYVCICNALTDKQIVSAIEQGARTVADAYKMLGVEVNCGQCICMAQDLIADVSRPSLMQAAE